MTIRVAVTGLNAVDSPGPGVPILRSLKESPLKPSLIGLAYDVLEPGNFMGDIIESSYIIPYPNASRDLLLERILYIHEKKKIDDATIVKLQIIKSRFHIVSFFRKSDDELLIII